LATDRLGAVEKLRSRSQHPAWSSRSPAIHYGRPPRATYRVSDRKERGLDHDLLLLTVLLKLAPMPSRPLAMLENTRSTLAILDVVPFPFAPSAARPWLAAHSADFFLLVSRLMCLSIRSDPLYHNQGDPFRVHSEEQGDGAAVTPKAARRCQDKHCKQATRPTCASGLIALARALPFPLPSEGWE